MATNSDITIFTTCKPFHGEAAVLQRNALLTWKRLGLPIIICGDEPGTKEIAAEIGAKILTKIARNDSGIPYVSSVFREAEKACQTSFLVYLNSDILLRPPFLDTVTKVTSAYSGTHTPMLMTCRRRNIPLGQPLDIDQEARLASLDRQFGSWDQSNAVDMFLFHCGLFNKIPDFTIGHMQWDNWLLWKAQNQNADIIDASHDMALLHPIHGYNSDGTGLQRRTQSKDAIHNRELAGGKSLDLDSATTHLLIDGDIKTRTHENYAILDAACQPDLDKEFWASIKHLSEAQHIHSSDDLVDCCRTILWRQHMFFPYLEETNSTKIIIKKALNTIMASRSARAIDTAKTILQDIIADVFLERLHSVKADGRPIYIWGCGQAGLRVLSFIQRHKFDVKAFIDSDASKAGTIINGCPVIELDPQVRYHTVRPYFIIGSMFLGEISEQLNEYNFCLHADYTG